MRTTTPFAALAAVALAIAGCGDDDDAAPGSTTVGPGTTVASSAPAPTTAAPAETTPAPASTTASTTSTTADDEAWREQVDQFCAAGIEVATLPPPAADRASLEAFVQKYRGLLEGGLPVIGLPSGPGRSQRDLDAAWAAAGAALDRAAAGAAAGDFNTVWDETGAIPLGFFASAFAAAGQSCGPADAGRAADAPLNVSIVGPWQVEVGYDSVWVSQYNSDNVVRIDPGSGELLATIAMPSRAVKLQPADGRMLVRTMDSYVAIDAATNAVAGSLAKADVGPSADRSWAVDGALWICDGQRLHRYDPTTLSAVALVPLGIDCGQVHATSDVAIAWTFNEDPGESGASRAVFVDPLTNTVIGTVELGADAGVPIVLDDVVFFPPALGSKATVVDRSTWTVTATPDLGRYIDGGSQGAFDGTSIYVIADKPTGTIAVIDPATFEVTGELMAMATAPSLNSLAATPGVLWAVNNSGGILQRFDTGDAAAAAHPLCDAAMAAEAATMSEDPVAAEAALTAAAEAAPDEIRPAVDTVIAESAAGNHGSPGFTTAYRELTDWLTSNCGFDTVAVNATDHAFAGVPDTLEAGPYVVTLDNDGTEFHQIMLMRVNDRSDRLADPMTLSEDEIFAAATPVGGAFAAPDESATGLVDLQTGEYLAICFLPTGSTPENMAAIEAGEHQGEPHYGAGMVQPFTVT